MNIRELINKALTDSVETDPDGNFFTNHTKAADKILTLIESERNDALEKGKHL